MKQERSLPHSVCVRACVRVCVCTRACACVCVRARALCQVAMQQEGTSKEPDPEAFKEAIKLKFPQ